MQGPFHSLRTLTIGADETNSVEADFLNADECLEILRTAPELVECAFDDVFYEQDIYSAGSPLQIADFDITIHDFISFLTRSAPPPLASLRMVMPTADWHPSLSTDLELFYSNPDDEADDDSTPFRTFLAVMGARRIFLPNLRNLTLWACFSKREDCPPHAPLQSFRLIFPPDGADTTPDGDIIVALRQFVNDEIQIHVGPQSHQFRLNR
ncbi:hypothetical protein B0H14DRAFT_2923288, partial [Mycena olivaceomarginata]